MASTQQRGIYSFRSTVISPETEINSNLGENNRGHGHVYMLERLWIQKKSIWFKYTLFFFYGHHLCCYNTAVLQILLQLRQQKLTLNVILLQVYPLQQRDEVGSTFSCAILSTSQNISA